MRPTITTSPRFGNRAIPLEPVDIATPRHNIYISTAGVPRTYPKNPGIGLTAKQMWKERPQAARLIAIGDIHGCALALDALLEAIQPTGADTIVVLGDFVDQGSDTRGVIDRLIQLEIECRLVCLRGNHEEMLLAALVTADARRFWENAGGAATIYSYRFGGTIKDIPDDHLEFISECLDYYETDEHIFLHANFDPQLPMSAQPTHLLRWVMLDPAEARCLQSSKTVICGHTEQESGEVLDLGCIKCIDTACWRYGWLTALDVHSGTVWQASRFGVLRQRLESPVGPVGPRDTEY